MTAPRALLSFFLIFLFFPYLVLLFQFSAASSIDTAEFWWALKNTFWQATFSALGAVALGLILSLGFFKLQRAFFYRDWMGSALNGLLLLPSFLPPIFILLILLSALQPFPTGLIGVVIVHVLMNAGLVCLLLKAMIQNKALPLIEMASIEGSSQRQFLKASFGMFHRDLFSVFIFVFVVCFTSFSVPLMVGGGRSTTLEILIYEKIRISGNWSEALSLSIIQLVLIMAFTFLPLPARRKLFGRAQKVPLLGSSFGAILVGFYCFGFLFYFLFESLSGWEQVFRIPGLWEEALRLLPFSLFFGVAVGLFTGFLLFLTAWQSPFVWLEKLITGIVSPSTALLGFSLLFFVSNEAPWAYFKWILGFTYLIFTTLYRWGWDQELTGLRDQIQVAESLGASKNLIFRDILFPQLLTPARRIASIASLWALGDFALGRILMGRDASLSLLISTLMSSYRLSAAMALMSLLLLLGVLSFLLFWGLEYVYRRTTE